MTINRTVLRLFGLLLLLAVTGFGFSARADDCYSLANGAAANIYGPNDVCKRVTNNAGAELCVTTYSTAEWTSFYGSPPANVTVGTCTCAGYAYNGYCYYFSNASASCDTACGSHGGCIAAGVQYTGSGAPSTARCTAVLTGMGSTPSSTTDQGSNAAGCVMYVYTSTYGYWYNTATTTCAATISSLYRACACLN